MKEQLAHQLLDWYTRAGRSLPWRDDPAPYSIWISEIMAQQTRLETVIPYYQRWMARFPDIHSLAAASQQEVLNLWEGLGYYSRARNLHKAAGRVVANFDGKLPEDKHSLLSLPGIGRYTAGAILSIAFGLDEPVVDGNIKRVYARLLKVETAINTPAGEKEIWLQAEELLPPGKARDFNQALMDLGAIICLPRNPDCGTCPIADLCKAHLSGQVDNYPVRQAKKEPPHYIVTAAVIRGDDGRVLVTQRPEDTLLGGMWEFPGGKQEPGETLEECLKREILEELACRIEVRQLVGVFRHAYTHFRVTLHAFNAELKSGPVELRYHLAAEWVPIHDLDKMPMGKIDRMIAGQLQAREE
ncbi:MAG: A/G-specific adenine glycosylase [Anaerolineales bacterium]|nr:A/G-specific adenine glycosylase [Anaerolineales bacterium]